MINQTTLITLPISKIADDDELYDINLGKIANIINLMFPRKIKKPFFFICLLPLSIDSSIFHIIHNLYQWGSFDDIFITYLKCI